MRAPSGLPTVPGLIDTTLREGMQRFGLYLDEPTKRRVAALVLATGVDEIELGVAGRCTAHLASLLHASRGLQTREQRLSVWCACREADLRKAARLSADRINMGVPVSDAHIEKKLGWSRDRVLAHVASMLDLARAENAAPVSLGLEDASRADLAFALEVARAARSHGAVRVRLSDTVGVLSPAQTADLVRAFRAELPDIEIALHCHNDFGLATANALAGLEAGADAVDVSSLGLGERAGIAALEQLTAFLAIRRGDARYHPEAAVQLGRMLADLLGPQLEAHRPVIGERLFWVESGLHADGVAKDPALYEPYDPAALGHSRRLACGEKSGRAAVARKLAELGLTVRPEDLDRLTDRVRSLSRDKGRALTDQELTLLAG